jgi:flavin reductase (DIM6/NTAB) family NADH-FMN oxidoreductase RutF
MSRTQDNPLPGAATPFSTQAFRQALGMFATGVTIVTARSSAGDLVGLTANSFNSVSLSPPLVLWSLAQAAGSMTVLSQVEHYAINILAADQRDLAERFASRDVDRWQGQTYRSGLGGAPVLHGTVAHFECRNRSRYAEGDHVIFVAEVLRCAHVPSASPLLFHGGRFYTELPLF